MKEHTQEAVTHKQRFPRTSGKHGIGQTSLNIQQATYHVRAKLLDWVGAAHSVSTRAANWLCTREARSASLPFFVVSLPFGSVPQ